MSNPTNPSIAQTFKAGDKLAGCYTLKEILPQQGSCVIWLAHDDELNKDIVLHFAPDSVAADARAMAELKQEAKRNRQLIHPRIIRVHDLVEEDKWAAISMDYIPGETLAALQKKREKNAFNPSELAAGIAELCQTLEDAHRIDLFHRDLTPDNLLATGNGVMVQNFGISRVILDSLGRSGAKLDGARDLAYISPQQLDGERPTRADDIYSLGASLFDLLTGAPPFSEGDTVAQIRKGTPPTVSERRAALGIAGEPMPAAWDETIAACLGKNPEERPKSAAEAGVKFGSQKAGAIPATNLAAAAGLAAGAATAGGDAGASKAGTGTPAGEPQTSPGDQELAARQQKRPWTPGPGKAPVIAEATVLSKTAVPKEPKGDSKADGKADTKTDSRADAPAGKSEPPSGAGGAPKKSGATTPTGFPLQAFVEVEKDPKRQKGKSSAFLTAGVVVVILILIVGYLVARNNNGANETADNSAASSGTESQTSENASESTSPPTPVGAPSPAEGAAGQPVNVAANSSPAGGSETVAAAAGAAAGAGAAAAMESASPAPGMTPATPMAMGSGSTAAPMSSPAAAMGAPVAAMGAPVAAMSTPATSMAGPAAVAESPMQGTAMPAISSGQLAAMSDAQVSQLIAEKTKAVEQAKAGVAAAEKLAADKAAAQSQAAAQVQQAQASIKQKSDAVAAAKKAADAVSASLKQQQDDLSKAQADADAAQKTAAAKAAAADQLRKAYQDTAASAAKQQAAAQQAAADAAQITQSVADRQKAADAAAKEAADADKARRQQVLALSQAQAALTQVQTGVDQARNAEKVRQAAQEAARLQKQREEETARLTAQAAAAAKAAEDAQKALDAAKKAVADAEKAQAAAEAQAAAAQKGVPLPSPSATPSAPPMAMPGAAASPANPASSPGAPTLTVRAPSPNLKVDQAMSNSLGMRFAPVGKVLFSIWLTRVQDFTAFAKATGFKGSGWQDPGFKQAPDHPVVNVSWNDANQFCLWLTQKEHHDGILPANETYRLPTDLEWSAAVGLPPEGGAFPQFRDIDIPDVYPWGTQWPPPAGAGNYTGEETDSDVAIKGYNDGFAWTSPVGSFNANKFGLFDMGGNAWEWCEDWWNSEHKAKVLRGGSWYNGALKLSLLSSCRIPASADMVMDNYGFRVVIAQEAAKTKTRHHAE